MAASGELNGIYCQALAELQIKSQKRAWHMPIFLLIHLLLPTSIIKVRLDHDMRYRAGGDGSKQRLPLIHVPDRRQGQGSNRNTISRGRGGRGSCPQTVLDACVEVCPSFSRLYKIYSFSLYVEINNDTKYLLLSGGYSKSASQDAQRDADRKVSFQVGKLMMLLPASDWSYEHKIRDFSLAPFNLLRSSQWCEVNSMRGRGDWAH